MQTDLLATLALSLVRVSFFRRIVARSCASRLADITILQADFACLSTRVIAALLAKDAILVALAHPPVQKRWRREDTTYPEHKRE